MIIYTYDIEVFKEDWLIVFQDMKDDSFTVIYNDTHKLIDFMDRNQDNLFIGFNSKSYDQYILKAMYNGASHEMIKNINDWIILGQQGWKHYYFKNKYWNFNNADIRDDCQIGLSLKAIEGHLGMDIEESKISFNIDRKLTQEEMEEVIFYCKHDVEATTRLVRTRFDYLDTKVKLGEKAGLTTIQSIQMTNAKLTAKYLGAERTEWFDGREYKVPGEVKLEYIPKEIKEFFSQIYDLSIPDEELYKSKLDMEIVGCPSVVSWGGVHGSFKQFYYESNNEYVIKQDDVSSLYPNTMVQYNYISRNIVSSSIFKETLERRMWAKENHHHDANTLKLPLNTASGAMENKYNDLYDPLMPRSLRITCQLFMIELVIRCKEVAESFMLINLNTDGLAYIVKRSELPKIDKVMESWQKEKRLKLERDDINRIWIKDVNNLLIEMDDKTLKTVGGYLNYGMSNKSGFNINNNETVICDAIINYLVYGITPEETIAQCNETNKYQFIAKSSSKFSDPFTVINGKETAIQNVNRVYASKNKLNGGIFHTNKRTGNVNKVPNTPENSIISNRNEVTIDEIDKTYYIHKAWDRIEDFTGKGRQLELRVRG